MKTRALTRKKKIKTLRNDTYIHASARVIGCYKPFEDISRLEFGNHIRRESYKKKKFQISLKTDVYKRQV